MDKSPASKPLRLQAACLNAQLEVGEPWSCIIFAEQKIACLALGQLLKACQSNLGFLRVSELMGFGDRVATLSQRSGVPPSPTRPLRSTA